MKREDIFKLRTLGLTQTYIQRYLLKAHISPNTHQNDIPTKNTFTYKCLTQCAILAATAAQVNIECTP